VVSDAGLGVTFRYVDGNFVGLPSMSLLGVGAEVLIRDSWVGDSEIAANLP